jgi:hypothetical protein
MKSEAFSENLLKEIQVLLISKFKPILTKVFEERQRFSDFYNLFLLKLFADNIDTLKIKTKALI